jgi:superfamily I DNA/RNA helicase
MSERFRPEEALREAHFIKKEIADQSEHEISTSADAAQYEVLSGRLDELHKSDPLRYEAVVRLSEMEEALENVRPDIRRAFVRVLELVGEIGWREALSRTDEIRLYINEQGRLGHDSNSARGEKINEVVEECLRKQLKQGEEQLATDPSLNTATVDELDKLRRYHLGQERLNLWRSKVTEMLERAVQNPE